MAVRRESRPGLRTAIRTHLAQHKGIEKYRAGEQNEGGDGVTVAFLK